MHPPASETGETHRVLLVEDDQELASMISDYLTEQGFVVSREGRGDVAADRIQTENPDIVILDVNLPGADGFTVCRRVRPHYSGPIVILTARGDEIDEIIGLEVGADDYIAKPVRPRVLVARIRAHLRKPSSGSSEPQQRLEVGPISIDSGRRAMELNGEPVELTTAEFDLLWLLTENAGQVLSRDHIYQQIHGIKHDGTDRSIDLRISRLRKKLGDDPNSPELIKSVRGVGYLLAAEQ